MARPFGSGPAFTQAKITVGKNLPIETMISKNVIAAVEKMAEILSNSKAPVALQLSAAKFFIEAHAKIAKAHGNNPQASDFIVDNTKKDEGEDDDKVIELKFKG